MLRALIALLLVVVVAAVVFFVGYVKPYRMASSAMEPTR